VGRGDLLFESDQKYTCFGHTLAAHAHARTHTHTHTHTRTHTVTHTHTHTHPHPHPPTHPPTHTHTHTPTPTHTHTHRYHATLVKKAVDSLNAQVNEVLAIEAAASARFKIGDRVECNMGWQWARGCVAAVGVREDDWDLGEIVPYQVINSI
jgi:hypothetical protein